MSDAILAAVEAKQLKSDLPEISVGDNVDVHVRIVEGSKERVQVFTGVVIKAQGSGTTRNIVVRIVANEGVERTFPVHSPSIAKIEVTRKAHARRARLYFLRDRVGKKRRLPDRRRGLKHFPEFDMTKRGAARRKAAKEQAKAEAAAAKAAQAEAASEAAETAEATVED